MRICVYVLSDFHYNFEYFIQMNFVEVKKKIKFRKKKIEKAKVSIELPSQYLQRLAGGCPQSVLTGMISWGHNLHRVHAPSPVNNVYAFNTMLLVNIISFYAL